MGVLLHRMICSCILTPFILFMILIDICICVSLFKDFEEEQNSPSIQCKSADVVIVPVAGLNTDDRIQWTSLFFAFTDVNFISLHSAAFA